MSEHRQHLRLILSPPVHHLLAEADRWNERSPVALRQEWRAAQIARSKSMHPTSLARTTALPALRPVH